MTLDPAYRGDRCRRRIIVFYRRENLDMFLPIPQLLGSSLRGLHRRFYQISSGRDSHGFNHNIRTRRAQTVCSQCDIWCRSRSKSRHATRTSGFRRSHSHTFASSRPTVSVSATKGAPSIRLTARNSAGLFPLFPMEPLGQRPRAGGRAPEYESPFHSTLAKYWVLTDRQCRAAGLHRRRVAAMSSVLLVTKPDLPARRDLGGLQSTGHSEFTIFTPEFELQVKIVGRNKRPRLGEVPAVRL